MGITHFDEAPRRERAIGHPRTIWTFLGEAPGSIRGDICCYSRSNKLAFRGLRVIARLEMLEYWDGKD